MTKKDLQGKVAVITGSGSGIGKATAIALADRGVKVVIGDISEINGETTTREINEKFDGTKVAVFQKTDVTKYKDNIELFQRAEKEFGGVDIAYLNAGVGKPWISAFTDLNDEDDENIFNINVMGVVKGTKAALLHLVKRGGGIIINTASTGGFSSFLDANSYCASKHAVVGWTRGFDIMPQIANIRINAVCPGFVDTNFMTTASGDQDNPPPWYQTHSIMSRTKIETVVETVLKFIEDESLNGETLLALPGGVIRPQPRPEALPECLTPEYIEATTKTQTDSIDFYRKMLNSALEKYEKST
ncbi:hypothetical protein BDA99DRAFT_88929 [Phascolomyces articulosus]|uniref:Uncharacterized protein n=1 Tax=Phascolomyces articulosus TaxID=60185 RepID=A0AAD5JYI4_9FUNG|nr:hypothetical protein BDA99DRAFT_88929 [Phascolomyces articulosus]